MQLVDFWLPSTVGSLNFHHPLTGTSGPVGVSAKWLGMPNLIGADFSQWVELTAENCVFFPSNWKMTFHKNEPIHYTMFFFKSRNIGSTTKFGKKTFLNKKSFGQESPKANNQQKKTTTIEWKKRWWVGSWKVLEPLQLYSCSNLKISCTAQRRGFGGEGRNGGGKLVPGFNGFFLRV